MRDGDMVGKKEKVSEKSERTNGKGRKERDG